MKSIETTFDRLSATDIIPGTMIDGNMVLKHDHTHVTFAFTEPLSTQFPEVPTIAVIKAHRKKGLKVEIPEWEVGDIFTHASGACWMIESINANIYLISISGRTNKVRKDILEIEEELRKGTLWIERDSVI